MKEKFWNEDRKLVLKSFLVSFILMVLLAAFCTIICMKVCSISIRGITHAGDRVEYYTTLNLEIETEFYYAGIPYGIDQSCVEGVLVANDTRSDVVAVLEGEVQGTEYTIDTDKFTATIRQNIINQFESELTDSQLETVDQYIDEIEEIYLEEIQIPGIRHILPWIDATNTLALYALPPILILMILCVTYLISLRRLVFMGLRYVNYSIIGAGLSMLIVCQRIVLVCKFYNTNISNSQFRRILGYFAGHGIVMCAITGVGLIVVGVIIIYLIWRQKYRNNYMMVNKN